MPVIDNVRLFSPEQQTYSAIPHYLLIEDGKILSIEEGIYNGDDIRLYEGNEHTLAPAFNDTHLHLLRYGLMNKELDLREVHSWKKMKSY